MSSYGPLFDPWPFGDLKVGGYGVIYADPPWRFVNFSEAGEAKNPSAHYECMTLDALKALPVMDLAAPDCALVMWATWPMLPDAIDLMRAWGFRWSTGGDWAKQSRTGKKWAFGPGYVLRSTAEPFIIGFRGSPPIRSHSIRNLIVAPVREHSRKPEEGWQRCEALFDGPYCELFARTKRKGWDVWGNQTDKFEEAA